jgi:hypothetical protein
MKSLGSRFVSISASLRHHRLEAGLRIRVARHEPSRKSAVAFLSAGRKTR